MQRTKRPIELKIVSEEKTLIDTNFGNACESVTVKDLGKLIRLCGKNAWQPIV